MSNRIKNGYADLTRTMKRHHLRVLREDQSLGETLVLKRLDGKFDLFYTLDRDTLKHLVDHIEKHPVKHATLYSTSKLTGHQESVWRQVDWHDVRLIHKHRLDRNTLDIVLGALAFGNEAIYTLDENERGPLRLLALLTGDTVYHVTHDVTGGHVTLLGYPVYTEYVTKHRLTDANSRIVRYITDGFGGLHNVESYPVLLNMDEPEPESEA